MSDSLSLYRELFSSYTPLNTNKTLLNSYRKITNDYNNVSNIRSKINSVIAKNYLNETVIKSSFIKRHLSKRSPRLNITIFELNANKSRADLCVINGESFVYEIKTEYDNYDRLEKQLNDYQAFFDYLYVIVPKTEINEIKKYIADDVGIILYKQNRLGNIVFDRYKKALLNKKTVPEMQLSSLTKKTLLDLNNEKNNYSLSKEYLIDKLLVKYTQKEINNIYRETTKKKYYHRWNFLHKDLENIYMLDYQWFFKNNINYKKVYR